MLLIEKLSRLDAIEGSLSVCRDDPKDIEVASLMPLDTTEECFRRDLEPADESDETDA